MPSLGADMEAGTLVEWLKHPGDAVKRGDIVAVVETQKGAIEIEVFDDGTLDRLLVEPGVKVPVGTPLALIRKPGEAPEAAPVAPEPAAAPAPAPTPAPAPVFVGAPVAPPRQPAPGARLKISPAAAARAASLGLDPRSLRGTGADGAITLRDVEAGAAPKPVPRQAPPGAPREAPAVVSPALAMRNAIGAAMARSKREIPHYYLGTTIDMGPAVAWLDEANKSRPVTTRLLMSVVLLKAVGNALKELPEFNGYWVDGAFTPGAGIHVGWAISLRTGGLIAPAIHDVDAKSIDELMEALRDIVKRARSGGLRSSELADGTLTVTSLGDQGAAHVQAIIYPPQVAIVGFGKLVQRPWVVDGQIVPRPLIEATLAADHRASDGHRGGLLLAAIERRLQEPQKL